MERYNIILGDQTIPYYYSETVSELSRGIMFYHYYCHYILIYDSQLLQEHIMELKKNLAEASQVELLPIEIAEHKKDMAHIDELIETLLQRGGGSRNTCLIAAGGGVLGNMVGMAAGLLYRGIDFLHIPTTLISCADSVLSMKQAVNANTAKNAIGLYYPAKAVFTCFSFVKTLPIRELCSGYVEFIKNLITILPEQIAPFLNQKFMSTAMQSSQLKYIIEMSVLAKNTVLGCDPREREEGIILEYGHTVGHALELASGGEINHGEGVAFGMLTAGAISYRMGFGKSDIWNMQYRLLDKIYMLAYLREKISVMEQISSETLIRLLLQDNKRGYISCHPNEIGMVLMKEFGKPVMTEGLCLKQVQLRMIVDAITQVLDELRCEAAQKQRG